MWVSTEESTGFFFPKVFLFLFLGILSLATSFMFKKVTCFVAHVLSVLVRFS